MTNLRLQTLSIAALVMLPACATVAQNPAPARAAVPFTAEELDNLVAPVALYPDPLLAQMLIAATFPDQVTLAARHVRERGNRDIDDQPWDVSVRAVAHYPPVLNMLYEDEDWAVALGQAYATQSGDVMDAVQRLREMAQAQGNLVSSEEQTVRVEREQIVIVPANPRVIYVPTYDPGVVFFRPVIHLGFRTGFWSFGIGFPIGDWLVYDVDWYGRRVYYDGWVGGGWRHYARPYIVLRPIYVHPRYRVIHVGRVSGRIVNYFNLERSHRRIHQRVSWERYDRDWRPNDRSRGPRWDNDRDRGRQWNGGDRDRGLRGTGNGRNDNRGPRTDPRNGARGGDDRRDGGSRQPGFGTLQPQGKPAAPRGTGRADSPSAPSMRGVVKPPPAEANNRATVERGGLVVTPRARPEPRATPRAGAEVRTVPSRPAPQAKPQVRPQASGASVRVQAPAKPAPQAKPHVRPQASAAGPSVRVQAPSKPAASSGSAGKSSGRSGSGSGKGKGGSR